MTPTSPDPSRSDPLLELRTTALATRDARRRSGLPPVVYISGALNGVPDLPAARAWYEQLAVWCNELGYEAYVPHLHADPVRCAGLGHRDVFRMDALAHLGADVILAELRDRSHGVGSELTFGVLDRQPILTICPADRPMSRYLMGLLQHHPLAVHRPYTQPAEVRTILTVELLGPVLRSRIDAS